MKEVKDLNRIEYAIYYWNNCCALLICVACIYLNWQTSVVSIVSGYIVYKILWFNRKNIYNLGLSRFYFLGGIFYISLILSVFTKLDSQNYIIAEPSLTLDDFNRYLSYVFGEMPRLLHWRHLVLCFAVGSGLYVLNVELRRKNIVDRDLMGIQVKLKQLYNINYNVHAVLAIIMFIGLWIVSWILLATFILIEVGLFYLDRRKRIVVLAGLWVLVASLSLFASLYTANFVFLNLINHGVGAFVKLQVFGGVNLFLASATLWLLPYLSIKIAFELFYSKETMSKIDEQNAAKQSQLKFKNGDFDLGVDLEKGEIVRLTDRELNQHMFIIGTTGAGKTVAILNIATHAAQKNYPLIFLDGKGQVDLVAKLANIANDFNRKFRVFTLRPEAIDDEYQQYVASYNPFAAGTFTEWKNRILALFAEVKGKGQQHFALLEEELINSVAQVLFKACKNVDLEFLYQSLTNIDFIVELAERAGDSKLAHKLENMDKELVKDVAIMLGLFVESSYGQLFKTDGVANVISLREAIENNEIILFLLDSSAYKSDTEKMAKLIINDINSSFAEIIKPKYSYCVFDEFASYASSNLSDTVSLMRSKGMCAVIGTQSIVSVSLKSDETRRVAEELKSCCNTYLCLAINNEQDAEIMGKVFNTKDDFEVTTQIDVSVGGATGMGSSKLIKAFNVHPEQLKNLTVGEGFLYRKVAKIKPVKIRVNFGY